MEIEAPKTNRKWPRLLLEIIVIMVILAIAFYVVAIIVFAIWHMLLIILRLFGLALARH